MLVFGDRDSGARFIIELERLLSPYRVERHDCDCEYCETSDGIEEIRCTKCRSQIYIKSLLREASDDEVEKYMIDKKIVCDNCGTKMYDNNVKDTIARVKAEYGLQKIETPVLFATTK